MLALIRLREERDEPALTRIASMLRSKPVVNRGDVVLACADNSTRTSMLPRELIEELITRNRATGLHVFVTLARCLLEVRYR